MILPRPPEVRQVEAQPLRLVLPRQVPPLPRGLHSSTFQLNLSAWYGIGGARRDCVARVKGLLGGVLGV